MKRRTLLAGLLGLPVASLCAKENVPLTHTFHISGAGITPEQLKAVLQRNNEEMLATIRRSIQPR